jgi:dipeptide transport system substrate-binding protein
LASYSRGKRLEKIVKFRTCLAATLFFLAASIDAAAQVKTLVFCTEESPDILNPQLSLRQATFDATARQVYDRLVAYAAGSSEIEPALAESWEVSEDGLRYRFLLRRDVVFHDGGRFTPSRRFNAEDVVFSFMRQLDRKHPYHSVSGGTYRYFRGLGLNSAIKAVNAEDSHTVVFHLNFPMPALLGILTLDFASILSAEYADAMLAAGTPELIDIEPLGTGPFQFIHYERDALIRFAAHRGYWRGMTPLDNLVFTIVPDAAIRYQKLRDRECHVIAAPDAADIPSLTLDENIRLVRQTGMDVGYLAFNTRKSPLNDRRVRKALAMAIDRGAIMERIYQGLGHPATTMIPADLWSSGPPAWPPAADIEGARRLLSEAGATGLKIEIWPSPVSRPYMPDPRRMAEMIREDWRKIGVDAKITVTSGRDFVRKTMVGRHDVALFGWVAETLDRSLFLSPILGCDAAATGANRAFWCNAHFDRLLEDAASTPNLAEREALYGLAQEILDKEVPILPIANSTRFTPVRNEVLNFVTSPLGGHYFYGVDLKR